MRPLAFAIIVAAAVGFQRGGFALDDAAVLEEPTYGCGGSDSLG